MVLTQSDELHNYFDVAYIIVSAGAVGVGLLIKAAISDAKFTNLESQQKIKEEIVESITSLDKRTSEHIVADKLTHKDYERRIGMLESVRRISLERKRQSN